MNQTIVTQKMRVEEVLLLKAFTQAQETGEVLKPMIPLILVELHEMLMQKISQLFEIQITNVL